MESQQAGISSILNVTPPNSPSDFVESMGVSVTKIAMFAMIHPAIPGAFTLRLRLRSTAFIVTGKNVSRPIDSSHKQDVVAASRSFSIQGLDRTIVDFPLVILP
jgi:hypothetical protein